MLLIVSAAVLADIVIAPAFITDIKHRPLACGDDRNGINLCKTLPYFIADCTMVGLEQRRAPEALYQEEFN